MKILVTAFEPFGEISTNSTQMVLDELKSDSFVEKLVLPVESNKCFEILKNRIDSQHYDYVILLGQASRRDKISLERIAINVLDFPIVDNAGNRFIDSAVIEGDDCAYFSTLPIRDIYKDLQSSGIPCEISNTAGTYICNEIFFRGLSHTRNRETKLGFIHFPLLIEQNCRNFTTKWTLSELCLALEKIFSCLRK